MATAQALDLADEDMNRWLREAFEAERAPRPCRLPTPVVTAAARAAVRKSRQAPVRQSFVLMLALSISALLLSV